MASDDILKVLNPFLAGHRYGPYIPDLQGAVVCSWVGICLQGDGDQRLQGEHGSSGSGLAILGSNVVSIEADSHRGKGLQSGTVRVWWSALKCVVLQVSFVGESLTMLEWFQVTFLCKWIVVRSE